MNTMTVMITGNSWNLIVWNKSVFIHGQLCLIIYTWPCITSHDCNWSTAKLLLYAYHDYHGWLLCNLSLSGKPQKWQNSLAMTRTKKICMSTEHIIIFPLTDHQEKMDDASTIWFMTPWLDLLVALKHTYLFLSPSCAHCSPSVKYLCIVKRF